MLVSNQLKTKYFNKSWYTRRSLTGTRHFAGYWSYESYKLGRYSYLGKGYTVKPQLLLRRQKYLCFKSYLLRKNIARLDERLGWHKFRYKHIRVQPNGVKDLIAVREYLNQYRLYINLVRSNRGVRVNPKYKFTKIESDAILSSEFIYKLLRLLVHGGKLSTVERKFYNMLCVMWLKRMPVWSSWYLKLLQSVKTFAPGLEIKNIRRGGKVYQIPITMFSRRQRLFILWFLLRSVITRRWGEDFVKERPKYVTSFLVLLKELLQFGSYRGVLVKQLIQMYKIAFDNSIFMHFRWG